MGLSEWREKHSRLAHAAMVLGIATTLLVVAAEVMSGRHKVTLTPPLHYFTVDDGKTFFTASQSNVPPFDYQGQTAVRACVFECEGHQFVGYMERYTPDARQKELGPERGSPEVEINGREVKKPGASNWVPSSDRPTMIAVTRVTCPDGSSDTPVPIEP